MSALRLVVIGAGHLGRIHAKLADSSDQFDVVAVVDPSPEARQLAASQLDVRTAANLDEVIGDIDAAVVASPTIAHYEEALQKDKDLQSSIRLFLLPGVLHCGGGTGPDNIDWVKQIQNWVENNQAPERLVMAKTKNGKTEMTRPVYPYPKVAIYNGSGDANQEKNYKLKAN